MVKCPTMTVDSCRRIINLNENPPSPHYKSTLSKFIHKFKWKGEKSREKRRSTAKTFALHCFASCWLSLTQRRGRWISRQFYLQINFHIKLWPENSVIATCLMTTNYCPIFARFQFHVGAARKTRKSARILIAHQIHADWPTIDN